MASHLPAMPSNSGTRTRRLFLRFEIGAQRYALAASEVIRILPLVALKHLPGSPAWVAGVLRYESIAIPVIDVSALAVGHASAVRASTRLVVTAYQAASSEPARPLGLLLEGATATVHYDIEDFMPYGMDNRDAPYLGPVRADDDGLVQWVQVAGLLPPAVRERLFTEAQAEAAQP